MRRADSEPVEKPRRNNPSDDNPVSTDDNPSDTPGGGGNGGNGSGSGSGGGRGNGGGNHGGGGRGGGHHGGDDDRDRHHRGRKHDDDDHNRRRHRRHHDDNANIYDTNNQNNSSNGASRNVNECDRGYNDGLSTGMNDARRGQSYDPQRSHFYKRGGGGLFSIGRSGAAKQEYRDCFLRGYEEGFRNYK